MIRTVRGRLRSLPPGQVDAGVTALVTAATVLPTLLPEPQPWWAVVLAVLASVPVLWRRRAPVRVAVVVGVAMTGLVVWQAPLLPYGPLVAVYTIAALSPPVLRLLSIPVVGVAVVASLLPAHEGEDTYRLLGTAFAAAYALGASTRARVERVRRLEQERETAAARERTRIARDMHDIVTHSVGLMVVQAEAGPLVTRSDPARADAAFDAIADTGRGALTQLRGLLTTLRTAGGDHDPQPGLAALPELVARTGHTGLAVTLTADGEPRPVTADVGVATYRIVQEALTNVLRHADADTAHVRLRWTATALEVEVTDDGRAVHASPVGGHGLAGMRERVAACGGTLRAGPDTRGFVVAATLPVG